MKKIFLLLAAVLLAATLLAEDVHVQFTNGKTMDGLLISYNEDLLVIEPNILVKYEKKIKPSEISYFEIKGVGRCNSINGKFVFDEATRVSQATQTPITEVPVVKATQPSSPNESIGKAFKTCGGVALGIGVPALAAGTILTAVGHASTSTPLDVMLRCQKAGYYLMPIGASLTIIGIPLCVQGKRIAELNFNYTGDGAGLALVF